ncbi:Cytosolic Ca2-dependent cysteine protease (calpain), large subunit (EF-Hand protein superfamily) [Phaffia rhodozyma]|uniref:Cytosolic Ca2-dependent cysteine protease (Calpain), large subunit (EF-Hand protein superfamily) n=1 Tax=Phaffia rhodozyma TaxID=264483 RepID=A0A0F7SQ61_PHARH|nr:Cytosolic Ca2-dependent cysteine protease (calpain), large subunit (EF-Hand protein superfamily) [Phaffia rhodozyma]
MYDVGIINTHTYIRHLLFLHFIVRIGRLTDQDLVGEIYSHAHLSLSPERAFPLYLQSAQLYSLLVRQAPAYGLTQQIKKEWAAVLDLAGKTKAVIKQRDGQGGVRAGIGQWKRCDPNLPSLDTLWDHDVRPEMIIQSHVRNCSLVAGIQAAIGWNNRFGGVDKKNLLAPTLYPTSPSGLPVQSTSGRYVFKPTVNGSARSLTIDSQLLFSLRGREPIGLSLLSLRSPALSATEIDCVRPRTRGMEYALGLIEKGWMKLMGGWDSGGSNSSVDLAGLTGWIPEVVRFHERDFQRENVWKRVKDGFTQGTCIMTLGTGALSSLVERYTGLISRHDYAITDLIERDGERFVQIVNPWNRPGDRLSLSTPPGAGAGSGAVGLSLAIEALEIIHEGSEEEEEKDGRTFEEEEDLSGKNRLFVVPWETVISTFDALYLNWDPSIFDSSCTVHSSWSREVKEAPMACLTTPRFTLDFQAQGQDRGEIWLWLTRHLSATGFESFRNRHEDDGDVDGDGEHSGRKGGKQREWIGLNCMEDDPDGTAFRTFGVGDISSSKVELTDSTHVLIKIQPTKSHSRHTLFVLREGSTDETRFTLSAFSTGLVGLSDGPPDLPFSLVEEGEFSPRSAGGNVRFSTFMNNPMYKLVIHPRSGNGGGSGSGGGGGGGKDERAEVRMILESNRTERAEGADEGKGIGPMNVLLVWGKGERVVSLVQADIVGNSGPYREKTTICRIPSLAPGVYTLIVSSFFPRSLGSFKLGVQCSCAIDLQPIAPEGAGMFTRTVRGEWNSNGNPVYRLSLTKAGSIFLRLQPVSLSTTKPPGVMPIRLSVLSRTKDGTTGEMTNSGAFTDEVSGAVTPRVKVDGGEYDVVVCAYSPGHHGRFVLTAYGDVKLDLAPRG